MTTTKLILLSLVIILIMFIIITIIGLVVSKIYRDIDNLEDGRNFKNDNLKK